jgi:hypothetical protein
MANLLITYDLNKKDKHPNYTKILEWIRQRSYTQLSESCYVVSTPLSPEGVYGQLHSLLSDYDTLIVTPIGPTWTGQVSAQHEKDFKTLTWLKAKLGQPKLPALPPQSQPVKRVILSDPPTSLLKEILKNTSKK